MPRSKEQSLDYREKKLVTAIRERPDLSPADAAGIEFMFFDVLGADEMPALAKVVASDPSWFREALMLCMGREDHAEDPPEWTERRDRAPEWLRRRAYRLFKWLPRLPGTTSSGYDVKQGLAWTTAILSFAEEHDRREVAESLLGQAFGSAGFHQDGTPTDELTQAPGGSSLFSYRAGGRDIRKQSARCGTPSGRRRWPPLPRPCRFLSRAGGAVSRSGPTYGSGHAHPSAQFCEQWSVVGRPPTAG